MTPNQARDALLETGQVTSQSVRLALRLGRECTEQRKADETYLRCPRCYGYHPVRSSFDNPCDSCQPTILRHYPSHQSVPYIKAVLAKWSIIPP